MNERTTGRMIDYIASSGGTSTECLFFQQIEQIVILGIRLELACNRGYCGESFQMQMT